MKKTKELNELFGIFLKTVENSATLSTKNITETCLSARQITEMHPEKTLLLIGTHGISVSQKAGYDKQREALFLLITQIKEKHQLKGAPQPILPLEAHFEWAIHFWARSLTEIN